MTKIGDSILTEFKSEMTEKFEDDNNKIQISQVLSISFSIIKIIYTFIMVSFAAFLALVVWELFNIDASYLGKLKVMTDSELLSAINFLFSVSMAVGFVWVACAIAFASHRHFFPDKKQERYENDEDRAEEIRGIIDITEEVLKRHGLIKIDGGSNV